MNAKCISVKENFIDNNIRDAYRDINFMKKGYVPSTFLSNTQDGRIISDAAENK